MNLWNRVGTAVALVILAGMLGTRAQAAVQLPQSADAPLPTRTACDAGRGLQLTLGLPEDHPAIQTSRVMSPFAAVEQVCLSTARGNPYQLLNWLENDHLQVVVLPAFAVAILARTDPAGFDHNYLVSDVSPFPLLRLRERSLDLVGGGGAVRGEQAMQRLLEQAQSGTPFTVALPHHLSMSVDQLFGAAARWAEQQELKGEARQRFASAIVDAMRFQLPLDEAPRAQADFAYVAVDARSAASATRVVDRQLLVVHRHILSGYPELQRAVATVQPSNASKLTENLFTWLASDPAAAQGTFDTFFTANFDLHQRGSISRRYFRFTIDELWGLLTTPADEESHRGFALVLTGGGVKAAYQTRLVERLYQSGRLRNGGSQPPAPESASASTSTATPTSTPAAAPAPAPASDDTATVTRTHTVDYVIGTSGGALLGIFVSALDNEVTRKLIAQGPAALTSVLWGAPGERIRSRDIFPLQDMLRYGSIVACFLVLSLIGALSLRFFAQYYPQVSRLQASSGHAPRRWLRESPPWIALMVFAPVFIVMVARGKGLEHMPAISGVLYILMALIALDADQRYTPEPNFRWHGWRPHLPSILLLAAGVAAILVSLRYEWKDYSQLAGCEDWQPGILLCSGGLVLIALALHAFFRRHSVPSSDPPRRFLYAFLLIMGIVTISYAVLIAGIGLGKAAILELSGSFWAWLLGTALVLSVTLMLLGIQRPDGSKRFGAAHRAVGFLFSEHPSRALLFGHRRFTRFVVLAVSAWTWWNLVAAPALYGNCNARGYFEQTYQRFAQLAGRTADPLPLAVPFVVTATSLEKSQERYFMFPGAAERGASQPGAFGSIDPQVWFKVVSDPRWLVVREFNNRDLQSVAFASGSPFPVFSSHGVEIKSLALDERYVDGGFAHNRPVDAARALGAGRVLVLNSSPLPGKLTPGTCSVLGIRLSELTCNLPLLVPYLWERSQTEDDLSSLSMLVASIYPTAEATHWPMLTDFRGEVVDRLIAEADADAPRRIGVVESWGAPTLGDASLVAVNLRNLANPASLRPLTRKQ